MIGEIKKKEIKLAIETTIGGGSLSLLKNGLVIDRWNGEREVSRSEELVEAISLLFRRNQINRKELSIIAVSCGPGSYTGARIGLATAIGLSDGLNIYSFGVSLLDCLFYNFGIKNQSVVVALSFGRNEVSYRIFDSFAQKDTSDNNKTELPIKIVSIEDFIIFFGGAAEMKFVFDQKLYVSLENFGMIKTSNTINAGLFLSDFVGQFDLKGTLLNNLTPIYPRNL